jgi:hypothetical protein
MVLYIGKQKAGMKIRGRYLGSMLYLTVVKTITTRTNNAPVAGNVEQAKPFMAKFASRSSIMHKSYYQLLNHQ